MTNECKLRCISCGKEIIVTFSSDEGITLSSRFVCTRCQERDNYTDMERGIKL